MGIFNTEREAQLNAKYESTLTELKRLFESLLSALELSEEENKKLKEENKDLRQKLNYEAHDSLCLLEKHTALSLELEKLKLSEEEKRLLKNIWMVAEGTGFPSVQPMSNARLIEKLT
eukprot:COSAG04_NODE_533_length_12959_cov_8.218497_17_plen_118_part_00